MKAAGHQDKPNGLGCHYDGHGAQEQPPGSHQVV